CKNSISNGNIFGEILLRYLILYTKLAPSAHVSRFGVCTNGVQDSVGQRAQVHTAGTTLRPAVQKQSAPLLRNVNLFLFVYVSEEVNQTTNKGHCSQPECDPSRRMAAGGVRIGHKPVKVVDCPDGGNNANHYRENIFQAFHFEPPARKIKY